MSEKIGFVGLGIMGNPMSQNLLKAGFSVRCWNRTESKMTEVVDAGAEAGISASDVASHSDIIITMLSDSPDVEEVILGENGILQGANSGSVVIDMSTIWQ